MRSRIYKKNFWFNEEEKKVLAEKANKAKMTESEFIRKMVLGYKLKEKPDDRFYNVMKMFRNTSNNLNQLAAKAHSLGFIDEVAYKKESKKLNELIDEIKKEFLINKKGD